MRQTELETTRDELEHRISREKRDLTDDSMMVWFLERAFNRISTNLRAKDKETIEASAPTYITPEVIKWEEMKRNTAGNHDDDMGWFKQGI